MSAKRVVDTSKKQYPEGVLGRKVGMTQVFGEHGEVIPVTVIESGPCVVLEVMSKDKHGYTGVQLGFIQKKTQRVSKAEMGHFAKVGKGAFYHVAELRCDVESLGWQEGQEIQISDLFDSGEYVDVCGITKGKGFQGVVRRFRVKGQPMTRGTHEYRRHIGAIGCRKFPGRVFPGKKMPGRMGTDKVTVSNLEVVAVRPEDNLILVKGGIPGAKGGLVVIKKAMRGYAGVVVRESKSNSSEQAAA